MHTWDKFQAIHDIIEILQYFMLSIFAILGFVLPWVVYNAMHTWKSWRLGVEVDITDNGATYNIYTSTHIKWQLTWGVEYINIALYSGLVHSNNYCTQQRTVNYYKQQWWLKFAVSYLSPPPIVWTSKQVQDPDKDVDSVEIDTNWPKQCVCVYHHSTIKIIMPQLN